MYSLLTKKKLHSMKVASYVLLNEDCSLRDSTR